MAQLTQAQREALEEGGLSQGCVDSHFDHICPHCGACRRCSGGCGCDDRGRRRNGGALMKGQSPRPPGRPRGSSPHGNPPGSDGCPPLLLRLRPEVMAQVRSLGGQTWIRQVIDQALEAQEGARGEEES